MTARPWLAHYDDGVPRSLAPYAERTLPEVVAASARERPHHAALLFRGSAMTTSRLERLSTAFAAALVRLGVRRGDRVALLLPACPQFLIAELGAWKAGAIVAPLDPRCPQEELVALLAASGAETIVALTPHYARVKAAQPRTALRRVVATAIKEHLPRAARLLFTLLQEERRGHRIALEPGDAWMRDLIELHLEDFRPDVVVAPEDPATLLASAGAGGAPRLVLGAHQGLAVAGAQVAAWIGEAVREEGGAMLLAAPLARAVGLGLAQGTALTLRLPLALLPDPDDVDELLRTVRRVRPAAMCATPAVYESILAHPNVRRFRWSSLRLSLAAGAPLRPATRRAFEELTGGRVIAGYGTTETQAVATLSPVAGTDRPGSVGLPLPDTEIRIVDREGGARTLPPGEVGEIVVHSPEPMRGYWRDLADTRDALRTGADGRSWLRTGDLGYLDEDGFLFVVGRRRERDAARLEPWGARTGSPHLPGQAAGTPHDSSLRSS